MVRSDDRIAREKAELAPDEMRPGVVCLPHGWGHDVPGGRLRVAASRPGVNSNVLTDGAMVDTICGNATLNAIPVTVCRRD